VPETLSRCRRDGQTTTHAHRNLRTLGGG
jgi:hypothetical protein